MGVSMSNRSERKILVIGGSSGIGAAIAQAFATNGDHVIATGVTKEEVERAWVQSEQNKISFQQLDVRDGNVVQDCIDEIDSLDVLVNCAGVIHRNAEHQPEVFADVIDINLNGSMRVCNAAREKLKQSKGCIINTASMLSFFGGGLVPGYSASKGGIAQLTKSLAIAYAPDGIRVNAVAPGWIATQFTQALQEDSQRSEAILSRTPLGRWGEPADVAGPVLFLASDTARFVTGVVLPVDGGYLIT